MKNRIGERGDLVFNKNGGYFAAALLYLSTSHATLLQEL